MVASSRLHRQADRFHHFNSIPNIRNFPSDNFAPQYKPNYNYRVAREEEEEPETVYIDMKVDSEEELETQYVNLFIDIVRNVNIEFIYSKMKFIF